MQAIEYRKDIDALRGFSILLVVIFHAFPVLIPGGYVGVDVFFVISGYLITQIIVAAIQNNDFSLKNFYAKRIRRLFPALIAVLFTAIFLGWLVLFPDEYKQLGDHVAHASIYVLNFLLISELGYFDVESVYKPILHLWTLSIEEQYYLLWPVILLIGLKQKYIKPFYIISVIVLVSFIANVYFINTHPENIYFNSLTRVWQLASGSLLAICSVKKDYKESRLLLFTGTALILFSSFYIDEKTKYPGWLALIPTIGAMLIIHARVRLKSWGGLVEIGLISYPLYLWHWLIISFLYIYIGQKPTNIVLVGAVAFSLMLAYVTYKYVERLRYVEGRHVTALLLASVLSIGLVASYVKHEDGLPNRNHMAYLDKLKIQFKRTSMTDENCENHADEYLNNIRLFDYCRSNGLEAKKIIAVIGDSHAHVIYPGVAKEAQENGYGALLYANSSCPPLLGFKWGRNDKEVDVCQIKIRQILKLIEKEERIEKVIIATRGPVYIHGEVKGRFTRVSVEKSLNVLKYKNQTYDAYNSGFKRTIDFLGEAEHIDQIYYMLENPELDFKPKDVIPRPFDRFEISTNRKTMDLDMYEQRMSVYREGVEKVYHPKLQILDPTKALCDDLRCYSYLNGRFLYVDDDHFSIYGSIYIAEYFKDGMFLASE